MLNFGTSPNLPKIRERENDPEVYRHATEVALRIKRAIDPAALSKLAHQAERAPSAKAKVILLRQMADGLGKAAAPVVACSKGCTHCCYMPVAINEAEARQIAKATGAPMSTPTYRPPYRPADDESGIACPFLADGKCSIYAHRPFNCRVHFVADRDDTLCEIVPGHDITAPHLDVTPYHRAYVQAFGADEARRVAGLREFFPHGLGRKAGK